MSAEAPSPPEFAYAPAPAGGRGLGAWSLAVGLITPVVALLIAAFLWLALSSASVDPWALLGVALLGMLVVGVLGTVAGILSILLGVFAVRRRRGRGLGIAGIALGGLTFLTVLVVGVPIVLSEFGA
jgi:hypothetical protein